MTFQELIDSLVETGNSVKADEMISEACRNTFLYENESEFTFKVKIKRNDKVTQTTPSLPVLVAIELSNKVPLISGRTTKLDKITESFVINKSDKSLTRLSKDQHDFVGSGTEKVTKLGAK